MTDATPTTTQDGFRVLSMNATMPALHIPWPVCGHCGTDVTIEDDTAWCDDCLITWDRIEDGHVSIPDPNRDDTHVACQIVVGKTDPPHDDARGNHYVPQPPKPCILPSGHEGPHLCPHDVHVTTPGPATVGHG